MNFVFFFISGIFFQMLQTGADSPLRYKSGKHDRVKRMRVQPGMRRSHRTSPGRASAAGRPPNSSEPEREATAHTYSVQYVAFKDFKPTLSPPVPLLTICTRLLQKFCYRTAINVQGSAVLARRLLPKSTTTDMSQGKEYSTDQNN